MIVWLARPSVRKLVICLSSIKPSRSASQVHNLHFEIGVGRPIARQTRYDAIQSKTDRMRKTVGQKMSSCEQSEICVRGE